jgi:hypothetical protein
MYRSARKPDLMDTSNPLQAVVHNTTIIDWAFGSLKCCTEFLHMDSFSAASLLRNKSGTESALVPLVSFSFIHALLLNPFKVYRTEFLCMDSFPSSAFHSRVSF